MTLTIDDLKPKSFKITVKGVELECKPLRLSHTLTISKMGEIFQDAKNASTADIKDAEKGMDDVISELIPELSGVELDITSVLEIITQMMEQVKPSDVDFLEKNGVKLDESPKVEKIG